MTVFTTTGSFSLPQLDSIVLAGATIQKYAGTQLVKIGSSSYTNVAFYNWVGSVSSLSFMIVTGTLPDPPLGSTVINGYANINSGTDTVVVAGLGLPSVPSRVLANVRIPIGQPILTGSIQGVPTTDGFTFVMTGVTATSGYILDYMYMM